MVETFMREAINLSLENVRSGHGGPFGAVVVRGDEIIGRGSNSVTARNDPTAHAEIVAIRLACQTLGSFQLRDCELYASSEPCLMCLGAIYWARLRCYYYANTRADASRAGFDDARIYDEIATPAGHRSVPGARLVIPGALQAFEEWMRAAVKQPY